MNTGLERWLVMQPRVHAAAAVLGAVALLVNTACYSYLPSPETVLPAGSDVRVELTAEGSEAMRPVVGPRVRMIEGRIRDSDAVGSANVDVDELTSWDGLTVMYTGRGSVLVPRSAVARVTLRTLDRRRSWVAAGAIGGVFVVAVVSALMKARSRASGSAGRIGGSPPDLRIP